MGNNENNQIEGTAFQGLILPISEGFFYSLSIEYVSYDGKNKTTAKGKIGGKVETWREAIDGFKVTQTFLEKELVK